MAHKQHTIAGASLAPSQFGSESAMLWTKLAQLRFIGQAVLITTVVAVVSLFAAPIAYGISGSEGPLAVLVGATVCWLGAMIALAIASLFSAPSATVYRITFAMLARTMLPLALGLALHYLVPWLAAAGMMFYLLIVYLATLAAETVLLVAQIPARNSR